MNWSIWCCLRYMVVMVPALSVGENTKRPPSQLSQLWRNIGRELGVTSIDLQTHYQIKGLKKQKLELSVAINFTSIIVRHDGKIVYERHGPAVARTKPGEAHSGVHVLVMHENDGHVMMAQQFFTYQPAEHERLIRNLQAVQTGRVIVVAGVPEWVLFLSEAAEAALSSLGCQWAVRATLGEAWACIGVMGSGVVAEGIGTRYQEHYPGSALMLEALVTRAGTEPRCPWYSLPGLRRQAKFCETYEGYGDLCSCLGTFFPEKRKLQLFIPMEEEIPVVVVTANKPLHLYRLLQQLYSVAGSVQTDILIVVDGTHQETLDLTGVMQSRRTLIHIPEGAHNARTNANVKFSLQSVFNTFPKADKAILLEDDLLISPDILSFFHQTAPLLDRDPTVYCINSYSSNSYRDTASDPRVLLRARTYPMYGWMVTRRYAEEILTKWVHGGEGDWDYWLAWEDNRRGRDVVFPEVSRTFHSGSAGVHVTGFEQETYFNRMIYNQLPEVKLNDINSIIRQRYDEGISRDLLLSRVVQPPRDLCNMTWVTVKSPRPLAVYVKAYDSNDKFNSYKIILTCCRTYDEGTREIYKGLIRLRWRSTLIYVIGCPYSPFCRHKPKNVRPYRPRVRDLLAAGASRDNWEAKFFHMNLRAARRSPAPLQEVFNLTNLLIAPERPSVGPVIL